MPRPRREGALVAVRRVTEPSLSELYTVVSLVLFERVAERLSRLFELERAIRRAGMGVHPKVFMARLLMNTLAIAVASAAAAFFLVLRLELSPVARVMLALASAVAPILAFAVQLSVPSIKASERKSSVESELPFFVAYASAMVRGGLGLEKIVERVAELKVFRAVREEARRIVARVRMLGEDPIRAMENVVGDHPSPIFRDFFLGYGITLRTGGDVVHYTEVRSQEVFNARMAEIRRVTERMMALVEVYVIVGVILSITLFVLFAVSGTVSAAMAGRTELRFDYTLPVLYNFLVLPVIGGLTLLMTHSWQPRTPLSVPVSYYVLVISVPAGFAVFLLLLAQMGATEVFHGRVGLREARVLVVSSLAGVLSVTVPAWVAHNRYMAGQRGLVRATADFLRELSEVRKTGLSPERCFVHLSAKDYGNLSPVVRRIAAAISLGQELEEAVRSALKRVREWFVIAVFRFLTDTFVVGGGSPEVIDVLARFTQTLGEIEEELRRRMRGFVILPYFGLAMLAASPVVVAGTLARLGGIGIEQLAPIMALLGVGGVINAVIMGLVAGKAGEMSVGAGFKHAALMSVVSAAVTLAALSGYLY